MKKKISLLLCVFAAVFTFTGCASEQSLLEYDQTSIEQVTEFLIDYCASADEATIEQWNSLTDFALEEQLTSAGLPFTPESFMESLDAWQAGVEECGEYIDHGDYTFEPSRDGLTVTTEAQFENRDASIEFLFDENLYLESMTISAHFSIGEILQKAGLNTLLGMGTVFSVLIFISLIISLFKYIPAIQAAFTKKPKTAEANADADAMDKVIADSSVGAGAVAGGNDAELIAVIAAAIAASEGTTTDSFIVRSIKRRKSNKWN